LRMVAEGSGWEGIAWRAWSQFHGAFVSTTLAVAIVLTVYSMFDYLWSYRSVVGIRD